MSEDEHQVDLDRCLVLPCNEINLDPIDREGPIIDLGGGGEGIIGLINGSKVIALDMDREELEGARNQAQDVIMDIRRMGLIRGSVPTVASFFTMMYLPRDAWKEVFSEVRRVLRPGGEFWIWDARFRVPPNCEKDAQVILLRITDPQGTEIETGYGCTLHNQDMEDFVGLAEDGFRVIFRERKKDVFHLRLRKT